MRKKILVDAYFAVNLGDDLFLKVLFDRYPHVDWYLLTSSSKYKAIFNKYKNVRIIKTLNIRIGKLQYNMFYRINELFFKYRKYYAYIYIGGSIFMENPGWEDELNFKSYLPTMFNKKNKKAFILGANFGPFKSDTFINKHREFFTYFDDICFRDSYSYSFFKDLNNVRYGSDIVFNLSEESEMKSEKSVGFSLIDIKNREGLKHYFDDYNKKVRQIIEVYANQGYKIKFFSFCESEGDLNAITHIINQFNKKNINVEIVKYNGNIEGFLKDFKSCEIIVGTRFHSVILALLFNQKVLPIIYSNKTYNVLKDLKLENGSYYIHELKDTNVKLMISNLKSLDLQKNNIYLKASSQFYGLDLVLKQH